MAKGANVLHGMAAEIRMLKKRLQIMEAHLLIGPERSKFEWNANAADYVPGA